MGDILSPMYPIIKIKEERFLNVPPASVLYSYQKCRCFYCNKYMPYKAYNPEIADRKDGYTIDHLFPRSLGFTKSGNSVLACRSCNEKKANRNPTLTEIVKAWELYQKMNRPFVATVILS